MSEKGYELNYQWYDQAYDKGYQKGLRDGLEKQAGLGAWHPSTVMPNAGDLVFAAHGPSGWREERKFRKAGVTWKADVGIFLCDPDGERDECFILVRKFPLKYILWEDVKMWLLMTFPDCLLEKD